MTHRFFITDGKRQGVVTFDADALEILGMNSDDATRLMYGMHYVFEDARETNLGEYIEIVHHDQFEQPIGYARAIPPPT